jgi:hypothetical protein
MRVMEEERGKRGRENVEGETKYGGALFEA